MTEYTVGFAFDTHSNVALIKKVSPEWQKNHLNGIGGHVDSGESIYRGMVREFEEEAGLLVENWVNYVNMCSPDWTVHVFSAHNVDLALVKTMTVEEVVVVPAHNLPYICLPNLRWLVPMAFSQNDAGGYVRGQADIWFSRIP